MSSKLWYTPVSCIPVCVLIWFLIYCMGLGCIGVFGVSILLGIRVLVRSICIRCDVLVYFDVFVGRCMGVPLRMFYMCIGL